MGCRRCNYGCALCAWHPPATGPPPREAVFFRSASADQPRSKCAFGDPLLRFGKIAEHALTLAAEAAKARFEKPSALHFCAVNPVRQPNQYGGEAVID